MICVTADTHGDYSRFSHKKIRGLKKTDHLIICGDFGFLWDGSNKEKALLKKIGARKHKTLFITGCHDNTELLSQYPEDELYGGKARCISGNLYMLSPGEWFDIDGVTVFAFGGGSSYDSDITGSGIYRQEDENVYDSQIAAALKRLEEKGRKADYIFTHEPPGSIEEFLDGGRNGVFSMSRLNVFFDSLKTEMDFKIWFFGKLHKNKPIPPKYYAVFDEPYMIGDK